MTQRRSKCKMPPTSTTSIVSQPRTHSPNRRSQFTSRLIITLGFVSMVVDPVDTKSNLPHNEFNTAGSNAMSVEFQADRPEWFAICTNPMQEDRAYQNLLPSCVECFSPRIQEGRRNQFTGAVSFITRPLFPRYIFARFSLRSSLRTIRFTRGVLKVVSFNLQPAPIDDEVIELMKSRVGKDGFINVGEALKPGDKVRIKDGPWRAIVGVIERNTQPGERVQILLTAINYQGRLMIERQLVEKTT